MFVFLLINTTSRHIYAIDRWWFIVFVCLLTECPLDKLLIVFGVNFFRNKIKTSQQSGHIVGLDVIDKFYDFSSSRKKKWINLSISYFVFLNSMAFFMLGKSTYFLFRVNTKKKYGYPNGGIGDDENQIFVVEISLKSSQSRDVWIMPLLIALNAEKENVRWKNPVGKVQSCFHRCWRSVCECQPAKIYLFHMQASCEMYRQSCYSHKMLYLHGKTAEKFIHCLSRVDYLSFGCMFRELAVVVFFFLSFFMDTLLNHE